MKEHSPEAAGAPSCPQQPFAGGGHLGGRWAQRPLVAQPLLTSRALPRPMSPLLASPCIGISRSPAVLQRRQPDARRAHEAVAHRQSVAHLGSSSSENRLRHTTNTHYHLAVTRMSRWYCILGVAKHVRAGRLASGSPPYTRPAFRPENGGTLHRRPVRRVWRRARWPIRPGQYWCRPARFVGVTANWHSRPD